MRGWRLLQIWAIAGFAIGSLSWVHSNPLQAQTTFGHKLSPTQVMTLKTIGMAIAVPSYIPLGFTIAKVSTVPCPNNAARNGKGLCMGQVSYQVLYQNPDRTCFVMIGEFTRGIGGGAGEFAYPVTTKLLGKTWIGFGNGRSVEDQPATPQQLKVPQHNLSSFPMYQPGTSNVYAIRTVENQQGCGSNRHITPIELGKILQSLVWL